MFPERDEKLLTIWLRDGHNDIAAAINLGMAYDESTLAQRQREADTAAAAGPPHTHFRLLPAHCDSTYVTTRAYVFKLWFSFVWENAAGSGGGGGSELDAMLANVDPYKLKVGQSTTARAALLGVSDNLAKVKDRRPAPATATGCGPV
eukprot:COSAG05_NODE_1064_length_5991_cov_12.180414_4_plen_148_part_00